MNEILRGQPHSLLVDLQISRNCSIFYCLCQQGFQDWTHCTSIWWLRMITFTNRNVLFDMEVTVESFFGGSGFQSCCWLHSTLWAILQFLFMIKVLTLNANVTEIIIFEKINSNFTKDLYRGEFSWTQKSVYACGVCVSWKLNLTLIYGMVCNVLKG